MIRARLYDWDQYKEQEVYLLRYASYTRDDILQMSHEERHNTCRLLSNLIERENNPKDD